MPDPTFIDVTLQWPNNDYTKRPTVENSTTEVDTLDENHNSVEWRLKAPGAPQRELSKLKIERVNFYTDEAKTTPARMSQWFDAGANDGDSKFKLQLKDGVSLPSEITLYYDLVFDDAEFTGLDWDPTLKIKPRP